MASDDSLNPSLSCFPFLYKEERCPETVNHCVCFLSSLKLPSRRGAAGHHKPAHGSARPTLLAVRLLIACVLLCIWTKLCRKCFSQLEKHFVPIPCLSQMGFSWGFFFCFFQNKGINKQTCLQEAEWSRQGTCWTEDSCKTWQFSDLIQASVLKPDFTHGDHQVAGKAGMVLSFPRNSIPSRSYSKLRLPTEGFSFDNVPFPNEKHCHQRVPHPVCSQTANVNLSFDPQGMCVRKRQPAQIAERGTPSDGLAALLRIKAATAGSATICGTEVGLDYVP